MRTQRETSIQYLQRMIKNATANECILWPFGLDGSGYGVLSWSPDAAQPRMRVNEKAHRLSYFLYYGKWPLPLGRHTCAGGGTPACFNPLHIIPGTDADNAADRTASGRTHRNLGQYNGSSKLTDELVIEIRKRSLLQRRVDIANALGLHPKTVARAIRGDLWKHLPGAEPSGHHIEWMKQAIAEHGDNPACIIWPFPSRLNKTPAIRIDGMKIPIHHAAYRLKHGELPFPTGRRTCNDDLCINPHHVYAAKKFSVRKPSPGEENPSAKLTWEVVRDIRKLGELGISQTRISTQYNISQPMVSRILLGKSWKE